MKTRQAGLAALTPWQLSVAKLQQKLETRAQEVAAAMLLQAAAAFQRQLPLLEVN
jgi:hypothetical protein